MESDRRYLLFVAIRGDGMRAISTDQAHAT